MSEKIIVRPYTRSMRAADKAMYPLMYALARFQQGDIQRTHHWHGQHINPNLINKNLCALLEGNDESTRFKNRRGAILFHVPFLGGWKKYSLFETEQPQEAPWHIGWLSYVRDSLKLRSAQVHRIPLVGNNVKLLNGGSGFMGYIFGINDSGKQIPIRKVDEGYLGDNKYPNVQLY